MKSRSALQWSPGASGPLFRDDEKQRNPDWRDHALCAEVDGDLFFPEKGGSTKAAKAVCRACPVIAECLEYALANDERFGIYGGKSERERRRVKRRPAIAALAA